MNLYENKQALLGEIAKQAALFIAEFSTIPEQDKDLVVDGVDRTPAQMIAYQLGWMNLLLEWEKQEQQGVVVQTPSADYKWNNLGGLYQGFYATYQDETLEGLISMFTASLGKIEALVESLSHQELFEPGGRQWAASTPANWPVYKWIHINTVAPFKTFRVKIRKWKKITSSNA